MTNHLTTRSRATVVLRAGLIAGALDALAAIAQLVAKGRSNPAVIFRYIASAVFGPSALTGGALMVVAGTLFHFTIALGWSVVYFVAAPRIALLRTNIAASAIIYGLFVWAMMNRVIVPLTRVPPRPFNPTQAAIAAGILVVCIGLPNAISAKRWYAQARTD